VARRRNRLSRRELAELHYRMLVLQELRRRRLRSLAEHILYTYIFRLAAFTTKEGSVRVKRVADEDLRLVGDAVEAFLERYGIPFESGGGGKKGRRIRVLNVPALRRLLTSAEPDYFVEVLVEIIEELQAKYSVEGRIYAERGRQAPPRN
jgi:hypothetical protein